MRAGVVSGALSWKVFTDTYYDRMRLVNIFLTPSPSFHTPTTNSAEHRFSKSKMFLTNSLFGFDDFIPTSLWRSDQLDNEWPKVWGDKRINSKSRPMEDWFNFPGNCDGVSCKSYLTRKLSRVVIYYQLTKLSLIMVGLITQLFCFLFSTCQLLLVAPRLKWESAGPFYVSFCELLVTL